MSEVVARRVVVHGRVQGVFFRDSTRREARRRGLAGWVRNRADGTVEAHFEGASEDVEAMVRWCNSGPRHADVVDVSVRDVERERPAGFAVR
ncbi:MAG: acylphosphatase [Solirubrobacteraceae bacterium]